MYNLESFKKHSVTPSKWRSSEKPPNVSSPSCNPSRLPFLVFRFSPFLCIPWSDLCGGSRPVKAQLLPAQSSFEQGLPQGTEHTYWAPFYCWTQDSEPATAQAVLLRRAALEQAQAPRLSTGWMTVGRVWAVFRPFGQLYFCNAFYNK